MPRLRSSFHVSKPSIVSNNRIQNNAAFMLSRMMPFRGASTAQNTKKIGMFGDIHFESKNLDEIVKTGDKIIETFQQHNVSSVVCLGDVLNTREQVSVQALSAALRFFDKLALSLPGKVHILLGNHDMNLRNSGRVSSLDALGLRSAAESFALYRDISIAQLYDNGPNALMIPYQEHQRDAINDFVSKNRDRYDFSGRQMLAFGHLAVSGAITRFMKQDKGDTFVIRHAEHYPDEKDNKKNTTPQQNQQVLRGARQQQAPVASGSAPAYLSGFRRVFSGHFHHHHELANGQIVYCGAPMQHHFGDSGDSARGVLIYEPETDRVQFVQNPSWDQFRTVRVSSESDLEPISQYKDKHVSVIYENLFVVPDKIQQILFDAGAKEVKKHSIAVQRVSGPSAASPAPASSNLDAKAVHSLEDEIEKYVSMYKISDQSITSSLVKLGKELIAATKLKTGAGLFQGSGQTFEAKLKSLTMQNFMGIQGSVTFDFDSLEDGIYLISGSNGSGKSIILEALAWVLFDKFIRSDMRAAYAVNETVGKNCFVRLEFENGYAIERYRKYSESAADAAAADAPKRKGNGIRVFKDGKYLPDFERGAIKDSQVMVEQLIGIDFDTFSKSIVLGEAALAFLTLDVKDRRETIEGLLGLNQFDKYLAETREQTKILEIEITKLEQIVQQHERERKLVDEQQAKSRSSLAQKQLLLKQLDDEETRQNGLFKEMSQLREKSQQQLADLAQQWERSRSLLEEQKLRQQQQTMVRQLQNQSDQLRRQVESKEQTLNRLADQLELNVADLSMAVLVEKERNAQQRRAAAADDIQKLQKSITSAEVARKTALAEIKRLQGVMQQSVCSQCNQHISDDLQGAMAQQLGNQQKIVEDNSKEETLLRQQLADKKEVLESIEEELSCLADRKRSLQNALQDLPSMRQNLTETDAALAEAKSRLAQTNNKDPSVAEWRLEETYPQIEKREQDRLREREMRLQQDRGRLAERRVLLKQQLEEVQQEIEESQQKTSQIASSIDGVQKELQTARERVQLLEFWERAFDKKARKAVVVNNASLQTDEREGMITMRSYLLERSIKELNAIFEEYAQFLRQHTGGSAAADHLRISFDNDLQINEEYGKRSAGQRRRNNLTIFFGLFELVRQHSAFRAQFLLLDEVLDGQLDADGQRQVMAILELLSSRIDKIFCITHSPYVLESFRQDHRILAEMTQNGTRYSLPSAMASSSSSM